MKKKTKEKKLTKKEKQQIDNIQNFIIKVDGLKFNVIVDEEIYSEDEKKNIQSIIDQLSKSIWLDYSYVEYKGNRFKDVFILETSWQELMNDIKEVLKNPSNSEIEQSLGSDIGELSLFYLYRIIEKYGYMSESVEIQPLSGQYMVEYHVDYRKDRDWNY